MYVTELDSRRHYLNHQLYCINMQWLSNSPQSEVYLHSICICTRMVSNRHKCCCHSNSGY